MGEGLKRVAKQCGGLTVKADGKTVHYGADGRAYGEPQFYCTDCESSLHAHQIYDGRCGCGSGRILDLCRQQET